MSPELAHARPRRQGNWVGINHCRHLTSRSVIEQKAGSSNVGPNSAAIFYGVVEGDDVWFINDVQTFGLYFA